jgi:hypothetical protein
MVQSRNAARQLLSGPRASVFTGVFQIYGEGHLPSLVSVLDLLLDLPSVALTGIHLRNVWALHFNGAIGRVGVFGKKLGSHFAPEMSGRRA